MKKREYVRGDLHDSLTAEIDRLQSALRESDGYDEQHTEIERMRVEIDRLQSEVRSLEEKRVDLNREIGERDAEIQEQARLLGMSSERELSLRAEIEQWRPIGTRLVKAAWSHVKRMHKERIKMQVEIEQYQKALANLVESVEETFDTRHGEVKHLRRLNAARQLLQTKDISDGC